MVFSFIALMSALKSSVLFSQSYCYSTIRNHYDNQKYGEKKSSASSSKVYVKGESIL